MLLRPYPRGMTMHGMTDEPTPERWTQGTVYADMWVDPDDDPREKIQAPNDERGVVLAYLRRYRMTLEMKCADLDAEQLARRSVPPSTMSLLGLVRHLTAVEHNWFRRVMGRQDVPRLYPHDEDFEGAVADPEVIARAWRDWRAEVAFADEYLATEPDLGTLGAGDIPLRDVLVHLVEEYARHCGHADFLRERIDGRVGQ